MRTNDVYFQPGDKVMRVSSGTNEGRTIKYDRPTPQYGVVYCVEDFAEGPLHNIVMLVGFGGWVRSPGYNYPIGWEARAFRKVDEIKLCVAAANHAHAPARKLVRA